MSQHTKRCTLCRKKAIEALCYCAMVVCRIHFKECTRETYKCQSVEQRRTKHEPTPA